MYTGSSLPLVGLSHDVNVTSEIGGSLSLIIDFVSKLYVSNTLALNGIAGLFSDCLKFIQLYNE